MSNETEQQLWSDDEIIAAYRNAFGCRPDVHEMALLRQIRDDCLAERDALTAELEAARHSIDELLGTHTPYLDGLTEQQVERYAQLSPPEMFRKVLKLEAELEAAREWQPLPVEHPAHAQLVTILIGMLGDISEESFRAGWMDNCESGVWEAMHRDGIYGMYVLTHDEIARLFALSKLIGGWVKWPWGEDAPRFVPMTEWDGTYKQREGAA